MAASGHSKIAIYLEFKLIGTKKQLNLLPEIVSELNSVKFSGILEIYLNLCWIQNYIENFIQK